MDRRIILSVCVAVVAVSACIAGAEDDLVYAVSLEEAGYYRPAVGEFQALRDRLNPERQILLDFRLGNLFVRCGNAVAAGDAYDRFLAAAVRADSPRIRQAVEVVTRQRGEAAEAAAWAYVGEDMLSGADGRFPSPPADLRSRVAELERYRLAQLAAYESMRDRTAAHEREYRARLLAAGRARCLSGMLDHAVGGTWYQEALSSVIDECSSALQGYEAELGPEAPFIRGVAYNTRSVALIELPGMAVQSVHTTVAGPSN
ncbi:MAG: hypothetical protein ABIF71_13815 [Planctomycetota bacterium]